MKSARHPAGRRLEQRHLGRDYVTSIARHTAVPSTGFFTNGSTSPTAYADFDASYQPINGLDGQDTASCYTVQDGDTLQSIAQQIWGDSNFWYLIADANGLNGSSQLVTGMDLIIPNKVANVANSNSTYRVYDPNLYIGDTSPTHPPKPHNNHNCGVMGEILLAAVAIAVAYFTAGALLGPLTSFAGSIGGLGLDAGVVGAGTAAVTGTTVAVGSEAAIAGGVMAGAIGGAAGSIVSQGVGLATGIQSKFNWGAVGMAAIGGAVGGGLQGANAFSGFSGNSFIDGAMRGAVSSIATQGIGVASGLQSKFDWAGVAAAGIGSGVTNAVATNYPITFPGQPVMSSAATTLVSGMAGGIANAAARTLLNGSDFGDNIIAALPDVIANTVGSAIAAQIQSAGDQSSENVTVSAANGSAGAGAASGASDIPDQLKQEIAIWDQHDYGNEQLELAQANDVLLNDLPQVLSAETQVAGAMLDLQLAQQQGADIVSLGQLQQAVTDAQNAPVLQQFAEQSAQADALQASVNQLTQINNDLINYSVGKSVTLTTNGVSTPYTIRGPGAVFPSTRDAAIDGIALSFYVTALTGDGFERGAWIEGVQGGYTYKNLEVGTVVPTKNSIHGYLRP